MTTSNIPLQVRRAMRTDIAFRVLSMDGTCWIDPFSGAFVPVGPDWEAAALAHLEANRPFERGQPLPLSEVLFLRWFNFLRSQVPQQPELRCFAGGMWLNPYNGRWEAGVALDQGQLTQRTLEEMARVLSRCPEAQAGRLLPQVRLDALSAAGPSRADRARAEGAVPLPASIPTPVPQGERPRGEPLSAPVRARTDYIALRRQFVRLLVQPPAVEGYHLVSYYEPHGTILRDFYDFTYLDRERLLIAVGECHGTGPGAALMPGLALEALRERARTDTDLVELVANFTDRLALDRAAGTSVSIFIAVLDLPQHTLSYIATGEARAFLLLPTTPATLEPLRGDTPALGSVNGHELRRTLHPLTLELGRSDLLLFGTGGICDRGGDEAAARARLLDGYQRRAVRPLAQAVSGMVEDARLARPPARDLTLVALRAR
jgi:hypothetical protein